MGEHDDSELFEFVEAALKRKPPAPRSFPADPKKVRTDAGYTLEDIAEMVDASAASILSWEQGRQGKGEKWRAWRILICRIDNRTDPGPEPPPAPAPRPPAGPQAEPTAPPVATTGHRVPRASAATGAAVLQAAVLDGKSAHVAVMSADAGGLRITVHGSPDIPCPHATLEDLPSLAARAGLAPWEPATAKGRGPRTSAPPVLALTACAATRLGLPTRCDDELRKKAELHLLRSGHWPTGGTLDAWPLLRPSTGPALRLFVLPWAPPGGLAEQSTPAETARLLDRYTRRLMPPAGPPAESGRLLMSWLHSDLPATERFDQAPHYAPDTARLWWRAPERLERVRHPVVFVLGAALPLAGAARETRLPTAPMRHYDFPRFDARADGWWLVDLSDYPQQPYLPVPFTADGLLPAGPHWYPTAAVEYAWQRKCAVQPIEAWLSPESGMLLQPWYERLREAYLGVAASLGANTGERPDPAIMLASLERMRQHPDRVNQEVLRAIAATEQTPFLESSGRDPGWMPYTREAVLARAAAVQHRRLDLAARLTQYYPLAATPHWVLYGAPSPDVFQVIARAPDGDSRALRLGVRPGTYQPLGHTSMDDYLDLVAGLQPGDPAAWERLQALIARLAS